MNKTSSSDNSIGDLANGLQNVALARDQAYRESEEDAYDSDSLTWSEEMSYEF
jgi:hypothetical protein